MSMGVELLTEVSGLYKPDPVAFWTAVAAIASVATVVVAFFSTRFAWKALRAMDDPKVIVYVKLDSDRPPLIVIVIENIGRDIAEDVQFTLSRPIPEEAFGISQATPGPSKPMENTPFNHGIRALGPGDPWVYTWGLYSGIKKALGDDPVNIAYTYRRGRRKFNGTSCLEVKSFGRLDTSARPHVVTATALTKIAEEFPKITNALSALEALKDDKG